MFAKSRIKHIRNRNETFTTKKDASIRGLQECKRKNK